MPKGGAVGGRGPGREAGQARARDIREAGQRRIGGGDGTGVSLAEKYGYGQYRSAFDARLQGLGREAREDALANQAAFLASQPAYAPPAAPTPAEFPPAMRYAASLPSAAAPTKPQVTTISQAEAVDPGVAELGVTTGERMLAQQQDVEGVSNILGGDPEATRAYMRSFEDFQDYLDEAGIDPYDIAEGFGFDVTRDLYGGVPSAQVTGVGMDAIASALGFVNPALGLGAKALGKLGLFGESIGIPGMPSTEAPTAPSFDLPSFPDLPSFGGGITGGGGPTGYESRGGYGGMGPTPEAAPFAQGPAAPAPAPAPDVAPAAPVDPRFVDPEGQYASGSFQPWWRQGYSYNPYFT